MTSSVLVIAPHADDEVLGCGGTIGYHVDRGDDVYWALVTDIPSGSMIGNASSLLREGEIDEIKSMFGFEGICRLGFVPAKLDTVPKGELVAALNKVFCEVQPETVYVPFPGDAHSDHIAVFQASMACCKWFRQPSVKHILAYETLSETNFCVDPTVTPFRPNYYVDISLHLERKVNGLKVYKSEFSNHPFPRSEAAVRALAKLRGSDVGVEAAEAFMTLRKVVA